MRIVKLSKQIFDDLNSVHDFFQKDLKKKPIGKFRFTKNRISVSSLQPNEKVLFTYNGVIYYKAITTSGRLNNSDYYKSEYPYYFSIDMDSLSQVNKNLNEIEDIYNRRTKKNKSFVQTRGWPKIAEGKISETLWDSI